MTTLDGRWALVTGAARRVGRSIALALAERGANVLVHHHTSIDDADALVGEIRALGRQSDRLQADLASPVAVQALATEALRRVGTVDVLVNSASNYLRVPFEALDERVWDRSLDVNLKAPYLLAIALGSRMRDRGEGVIINVVDWAADRPYRDYLPYCVSKAGLVCLTKALARELAPAVRVNAVAPGPVLLPEDMSPEEAAAIVRATPLARIGRPEDVAACVVFLATDAAFSTGAIFHVDGGRAIA
jgi:NAD(P)-dependent dehydrogenase (short-subunit alcohol dehydrogenase family)